MGYRRLFQNSRCRLQRAFAIVAHKDTIRVFLALVNYFDLECDQVDIIADLLKGGLEETIYTDPPEGSDIPNGKVFRLGRSCYGLKQSPGCFNKAFDKRLRDQEFCAAESDPPCLHTRFQDDIASWCQYMYVINLSLQTLDLPWIHSRRYSTLSSNARTLDRLTTSLASTYIEIERNGNSIYPKNTTWKAYLIILTWQIVILARSLFPLDFDLYQLQMTSLL